MADINMGFHTRKPLKKTDRIPLVFASGDTVKSFTIDIIADLTRIVFEMPNFSGAEVTGAVSIENSDGKQIYNKDGMIESETHVRAVNEPLIGENTVKVTLSTDPLSDGTCYVTLYVKGD